MGSNTIRCPCCDRCEPICNECSEPLGRAIKQRIDAAVRAAVAAERERTETASKLAALAHTLEVETAVRNETERCLRVLDIIRRRHGPRCDCKAMDIIDLIGRDIAARAGQQEKEHG